METNTRVKYKRRYICSKEPVKTAEAMTRSNNFLVSCTMRLQSSARLHGYSDVQATGKLEKYVFEMLADNRANGLS